MTDSEEKPRIEVKVDPDIAPLIPEFLKRRETDVRELLKAVELGDFDRLRTLGHQMKGSGAGYGFLEISEIGAKIESAAVSKKSELIPTLAVQLADYLERIEVVFE